MKAVEAAGAALWDDEMCAARIDGRAALVLRLDGELFAYEDRCPHLGLPLSAGKLCDGVLTCVHHCWSFDARTGRGINPRSACLRTFATEADG